MYYGEKLNSITHLVGAVLSLIGFGANGETAPPDIIRKPYGRIAIGHSELRGHQYWSGAAGEGRRAVESLIDQYF